MEELIDITKNSKLVFENKLLNKYFFYRNWFLNRNGCNYYCCLVYTAKFCPSYHTNDLMIYCYSNKTTARYEYSNYDFEGSSLKSNLTDNFSDQYIINIIKESAPLYLIEDLEKYVRS